MIPPEPLNELNAQHAQILALDTWLMTPAGRYFVGREQRWIDAVVPDLFGFRALQLGTRLIDSLKESRIPHKAYVQQDYVAIRSFSGDALNPDCFAQFEDLPFESQSLDLIVLPHVLEFSQDPHRLLREVERVLMPEGRVIVTGFNPLSLWGLQHAAFRQWAPVWPMGCNPIHLSRLKDWLKLLSFEPEFGRFAGYRFASSTQKGLSRMGFMEYAGDRWWPMCGAVYCLCAVKRVCGMRLVGAVFKDKKMSATQFKPATNKALNKAPTMTDHGSY